MCGGGLGVTVAPHDVVGLQTSIIAGSDTLSLYLEYGSIFDRVSIGNLLLLASNMKTEINRSDTKNVRIVFAALKEGQVMVLVALIFIK